MIELIKTSDGTFGCHAGMSMWELEEYRKDLCDVIGGIQHILATHNPICCLCDLPRYRASLKSKSLFISNLLKIFLKLNV